MDALLILQADHEQNASTSTVRTVGSSRANPFACVAAGISSLWGPLHGGANEEVIKMLEKIGEKKRIPDFIKRAKDKDDAFRLMGFGHRVYKSYDPRAKVMKQICEEVLKEIGHEHDPLLEIAVELEKIALEDRIFRLAQALPERRLLFGHRRCARSDSPRTCSRPCSQSHARSVGSRNGKR